MQRAKPGEGSESVKQIRFENDMNHRSIRANKLRQIKQLPRTMTDDPTQSASGP
jgi:hypothetical protein